MKPQEKINSNKTKHVLVENELRKLKKKIGQSYFKCKNHFEEDGRPNVQNILKRFLILKIFQNGNVKDCLMKLLNLLIIHLLQR